MVNVVLVLRTSEPEHKLRDMIPSLELVLSAHATDAVPQGSGNVASASGKHDLDSKTIAASMFAQLATIAEKTVVVWRPTLHLSRPRVRLQRPAVYFTANLTFTSEAAKGSSAAQHDYLKSFEPLPANILEALQFDPALKNFDISLPESRVTKVAPRAPRQAMASVVICRLCGTLPPYPVDHDRFVATPSCNGQFRACEMIHLGVRYLDLNMIDIDDSCNYLRSF